MRPLSDRTLERYLLGELSEAERRTVERALENDETARMRLERLESSNAEILEFYPPVEMAAAIQTRLGQEEEPRGGSRGGKILPFPVRLGRFIPAVAVAAALLVLAFPVRQALVGSGLMGGDTTRMKGLDARLEVYRSTGSGVQQLSDGSSVREGDLLQLSYVAAGARRGVILSIDGNGVITYHYPETAAGNAPELVPGGEVPLSFAYQLDNAPDFERFFFVTSQKSFSLDEIDRAARRLTADPESVRQGELRLGRGLNQYSLTLSKGETQ